MNAKTTFIIMFTSLSMVSFQVAIARDEGEPEPTVQIADTKQECEKADSKQASEKTNESKRECKIRASERHRMAKSLRCRNKNSGP